MSDLLAAVQWTTEVGVTLGIRVINLSLVTFIPADTENNIYMRDYICGIMRRASDAGIVVTAAAGNYATSMEPYLPASCPTVVAVTAVNIGTNKPAGFSNFIPALNAGTSESTGTKALVMAAPGMHP